MEIVDNLKDKWGKLYVWDGHICEGLLCGSDGMEISVIVKFDENIHDMWWSEGRWKCTSWNSEGKIIIVMIPIMMNIRIILR